MTSKTIETNQDGRKHVMVDVVFDKGIARKEYDPQKDIQEYEENGLHGLKTPEGEIAFPAIYDRIIKWPDSDVVYTLKGREFHYWNTAGEEILTEVPPIEGLPPEEDLMPWFITEEQSRPYVIIMRQAEGPVSGRCCMYRGQWVELDRIPRKDVRKIMKTDTAEFDNGFTYIYYGYDVRSADRKDSIRDCIERLESLGCYQSSWNFLTRVYFPNDDTTIVAGFPQKARAMMVLDCLSPLGRDNLRRVSFGTDETLSPGETRIVQIHYFHDRWPLLEEQEYDRAVVEGTLQEMTAARAMALTAIQQSSLPEKLHDALWDFPKNKHIPSDMFRCPDAGEMVRKLDWLKSAGYVTEAGLWESTAELCRQLEYRSMFKEKDDPQVEWLQSTMWRMAEVQGKKRRRRVTFDFGHFIELAGWYLSNGEGINTLIRLRTPLDILEKTADGLKESLSKGTAGELDGIISWMKAKGAMTGEEYMKATGYEEAVNDSYSYAIK